jgi:small subunit ribosomal protein S13
MARIAGVNVPTNKRAEIGLTYVHGIGRSTANDILKQVGVDPNTYVRDLTDDEVVKLREAVESREVEGDLRTAASVTVAGFPRAASARRQMLAAARARAA